MGGFLLFTFAGQYGKIEKGSKFTAWNVLLLFNREILLPLIVPLV